MTKDIGDERPIDPERPIIDPHLHLWETFPAPGGMHGAHRFFLPETLDTIERSGHNVTHSVFVQCHTMYRQDGPVEYQPVGETEFANGVAAMSASGNYGPRRIAHRIVGCADLTLGGGVAPVLEAHVAAAGIRFRGVRHPTAYSKAGMFGAPPDPMGGGAMLNPLFHEGARILGEMDLSLDIWCFHSQLDELIALATALPELMIILDHVGTPESAGAYAGREAEVRRAWQGKIAELARRPNVSIKLGGLGMNVSRAIGDVYEAASSELLAARWRPYIESCIDAFTPQRCMFESNFPPDNAAGSYGAVWNAFKIITAGFGEEEKDQLFRRTAANVYHIPLD